MIRFNISYIRQPTLIQNIYHPILHQVLLALGLWWSFLVDKLPFTQIWYKRVLHWIVSGLWWDWIGSLPVFKSIAGLQYRVIPGTQDSCWYLQCLNNLEALFCTTHLEYLKWNAQCGTISYLQYLHPVFAVFASCICCICIKFFFRQDANVLKWLKSN